MKKQITRDYSVLKKAAQLLDWQWLPWVASAVIVSIYGVYLFATDHLLLVNDFFGHVWMALEDREGGLGSSTNSVIPAGYPILLNLFHAFGLQYMNAGRLLTLIAAVPLLAFVWRGASRWGELPWAGPVAWLLTATSYHFMLAVATPLPDIIALSMTMPLIVLAFKPDRSLLILMLSSLFAGLACGIRYTFFQSVVPLAVFLVLFSHTLSWKKRVREALVIALGLTVGLLPEIIFALHAGHVPFQNSSKYYLTLLVGETDFMMTGTQLRNMPSTFEYITMHLGKILYEWGRGYIHNLAIFVVAPGVVWWLTEEIGTMSNREKLNESIRRELISLLIFVAILLIPVSLRQPMPYYVMPLLLCISFMVVAIQVVKLAGMNNVIAGTLIIGLCAVSTVQIRSAVVTLENNPNIAFNKLIASELYGLGIRDSTEVLNLVAPFELYWPYGDKSPSLYYTLKEPGWLSLTNTLSEKRPFIYKMTKDDVKRFRIVMTHPISYAEKVKFLPEFELVRRIGGVQIYKSALTFP